MKYAMSYNTASEISQAMGESNDCAVKAIAIATQTDYRTVHAMLKAAGRKDRKGTHFQAIKKVVGQLGFEMEQLAGQRSYSFDEVAGRYAKLVGRAVKTAKHYLIRGEFLVFTRGHVLAVRDGVAEDWTAERGHRVTHIFKVVSKSEPVQPAVLPEVKPVAPVAPVQPKPAPVQPVAPKRGTVKALIHAVANQMWEEAGKPMDKKVVLALRIRIMDVLGNSHEVKRTSASVELGNWMKGLGL